MTIEIKINGEAAELHDVLRALLNSTAPATATTTAPEANSIDLRKTPKPSAKVAKETPAAPEPTPQPEPQAPEPIPQPEPQVPKPQAPEPQAPEPTPTPEPQAPEPTTHTFEEFRAAVGAAALKDKAAVKLILSEFGASKTSEVDPKNFDNIMFHLSRIN